MGNGASTCMRFSYSFFGVEIKDVNVKSMWSSQMTFFSIFTFCHIINKIRSELNVIDLKKVWKCITISPLKWKKKTLGKILIFFSLFVTKLLRWQRKFFADVIQIILSLVGCTWGHEMSWEILRNLETKFPLVENIKNRWKQNPCIHPKM